jgi:hypothetical protein
MLVIKFKLFIELFTVLFSLEWFFIAVFISIPLEIAFVKKLAGRIGIGKKANWIKAVLISTIIATITFLTMAYAIKPFWRDLINALINEFDSVYSSTFVIYLLACIVLTIFLRISTYAFASPIWKEVPATKKILFCCGSGGLVSLLSIALAFCVIQFMGTAHNTRLQKEWAVRLAKEKAECPLKNGTWDAQSFGGSGDCVFDTQEKCIARGGEWRRVCMNQTLECITKYKDAGKACVEGRDCTSGMCRDVGNKPNKQGIIYGVCVSDNDPCSSCFSLIDNGKDVGPFGCAD